MIVFAVLFSAGYFYYPNSGLNKALAQTPPVLPPPASYPIEGRFVHYGYDATLSIPGDLTSAIPGGSTGAASNGILWALPSRNVIFHPDLKVWELEVGLWNGTTYVWRKTFESSSASSYYPEADLVATNPHYWLEEEPQNVRNLGAGVITCYGIDINLVVPKDLSAGTNNGILFALPVRNVHIVGGGELWHLEMFVQDLDSVQKWKETVLATDMCSFAPSA